MKKTINTTVTVLFLLLIFGFGVAKGSAARTGGAFLMR